MNWQISRVGAGTFGLDGGAMFGIVPKPLWEKQIPADAFNRIPMQSNCMLLVSDEHKVIVETGCGFDFDEKARAQFNMSKPLPWQKLLEPHQIAPTDITDVIVTHLHFDHAAGLSYPNENGSRSLSFPNATHHVQSEQLNWAKEPTAKDRGSYRVGGIWPFTESGAKIALAGGAGEILPGISVQTVNGHTKAQQLVHVDSDEGRVVFVADLLPTSAHLHLPWIMAYDITPLESLQAKESFLKEALASDWTLWFYHDPKVLMAKATYDGKRYKVGSVLANVE